jgi:hypothetical protein
MYIGQRFIAYLIQSPSFEQREKKQKYLTEGNKMCIVHYGEYSEAFLDFVDE